MSVRLPGMFKKDFTVFMIFWILLLLAWMPAYIALYPGTFGYDTPIQMEEYFGYRPLDSHHPLLHTFIMGSFMKLGDAVFQSYSRGLAMFTLFQGMVVTNGLACLLLFLKKRGLPKVFLALSLLWLMFHPFLQVLTFNSTKDILFGAAFLHFMIAFSEMMDRKGEEEPGNTGQKAYLLVSGVLMCLLRNQGIYILAITTLLCIFLRIRKKGVYKSLAGAILISAMYFLFCAHVLQIPAGDMREMLSLPMQQIARVCSESLTGDLEKEMPQEWLEIAEEIIPEENILAYQPNSADAVKDGFLTDILRKNPCRYISLYLSLGIRYPALYAQAAGDMILPYLDMRQNEYRGLMFLYTFPQIDHWGILQHRKLPEYRTYLENMVLYDAPRLFDPGCCIWIMALIMVMSILQKRKDCLIEMLPAVLFLGTNLLGPVALLRYSYPLMLITPLLAGMLLRTAGYHIRLNHKKMEK